MAVGDLSEGGGQAQGNTQQGAHLKLLTVRVEAELRGGKGHHPGLGVTVGVAAEVSCHEAGAEHGARHRHEAGLVSGGQAGVGCAPGQSPVLASSCHCVRHTVHSAPYWVPGQETQLRIKPHFVTISRTAEAVMGTLRSQDPAPVSVAVTVTFPVLTGTPVCRVPLVRLVLVLK